MLVLDCGRHYHIFVLRIELRVKLKEINIIS